MIDYKQQKINLSLQKNIINFKGLVHKQIQFEFGVKDTLINKQTIYTINSYNQINFTQINNEQQTIQQIDGTNKFTNLFSNEKHPKAIDDEGNIYNINKDNLLYKERTIKPIID